MSVCGYNEKVGRGLLLLAEGLADELVKKVHDHGDPLAVLRRELIELSVLMSRMDGDDAQVPIRMFYGLNYLAKAMFEDVLLHLDRGSDGEDVINEVLSAMTVFDSVLSQTEDEAKAIHSAGRGTNAEEFADTLANAVEVIVKQSEQTEKARVA